jgi:uncharacterized protein with gpF-like domain
MADYGSLPFLEAIEYLRSKVDVPTERWDDILGLAHDHAFMVAGAAKASLIADLHAAVMAAVEEGISLGAFTDRFEETVARHGWTGWTGEGSAEGRAWRARVIYGTNLRASYAAGRLSQMRAIQDRRPYWRYRHNDTVTTPRPLHQSWNGVTLPADDPWWNSHYCPSGFGCRCYVETLAAADLGPKGLSERPDDGTYEVTDRRTGETRTLPRGIDYGWDHMPGDTRALQDDLRARADRLPPGVRAGLLADLAQVARG